MSRGLSVVFVALSLSLLCLYASAGVGKNAMLLQDVSTLIFTKGEMTNSRRSSPVPQMSCKGGPCQYAPTTAMCRNIGFDGSDVTWQCEAELPKGVKFGKVEVSCEGHSSRDDEYVLKGSCGLEYQLQGEARFDSEVKEEDSWWNRNVRNTAGKHPAHRSQSASSWFTAPWNWLTGAQAAAADQYNHARDYAHHQYEKASHHAHHDDHHHGNAHHGGGQHGAYYQQESTGLFGMLSYLVSSLLSMGVKAIAAMIVLFVLWRLMRPATSVQQPVAARRPGMLRSVLGMLPLFGGSGLSGVFDNSSNNHANPPPYNPPPPPYDAAGFDKRYYTSAAQQQQAQQAQAQQQGGSGYNVLHGLLGGSVLGYFMGQRRANQQQQRTATYTQQPTAAYQQPSTVHHVHHNAPPSVNPAYVRTEQRYPTAATHTTPVTRADGATLAADGTSIEDVSDVRTSETSTAYARTKRR